MSARPVYQSPRSYYLALGDSIAYGFQPTKASAPPAAVDTGYVDLFAAHLRKLSPKLRVVNYGCPGESAVTFTRGGCDWLKHGGKLHHPFRGSQLKAALSFLRAQPGKVSPITVTLWGNDLPLPLSRNAKRAPNAIASFAKHFSSILRQLRARGTERRDHRDRSVEPRGRSTRTVRAALPLGRRGHQGISDRVARARREHVFGVGRDRQRQDPASSALPAHVLLLEERSAPDRRGVLCDGGRLHERVGLPKK
jgi:lysophospholipase L1-like esterase